VPPIEASALFALLEKDPDAEIVGLRTRTLRAPAAIARLHVVAVLLLTHHPTAVSQKEVVARPG
jgi:hypothetical protein